MSITAQQRLALVACIFLNTAATGYLQPFVALYEAAAGLTTAQIGLIAGLGSGTVLLIQPLLGRLSDTIDARRPMMFLAAIMAGLAYFGFCKATGFQSFLLLTVLGVNGVSYLNVAAGVLVGRISDVPAQAGRAYAGYRVWGSIGYIIVALVTGFIVGHGASAHNHLDRGHITPVFTWGSLIFVCVALVSMFVPDRKKDPNTVAESGYRPVPNLGEDTTITAPTKPRGFRLLPGSEPITRNLKMFLLAFFLYSFAMSGMFSYLGIYMKRLGESPLWITGTFAAGVICEVLVMVQIGRWTDTYGRRPALAVAFLVLPLRLLLYIPARGPVWIMCVHLLHGLNFGIMGAIAVVFVNDIATNANRGLAQARLAAVQGLAAATAPMLGGELAFRFGMGPMFAIMAAIAASGAIVFLTQVHESHPSPSPLVDRFPEPLRPVVRLLVAPR